MTYLKRSSRPRRGQGITALIVAGLVIVFGINYFFPTAYPAFFYPIASAFWRAESSTVGAFVYMGKIVQSKYSLVEQNKKLEDQIAAQDRSMLELQSLQAENETLKTALSRTGKGDYILGVILTRPPVSPYDTLVLDIGIRDGVKVGDKVYADGDILVGDIAEVYSNQSKASLYSTPGRVTSVLVGSSTVAAQATGSGGGEFSLKLPAEVSVVKGASIIQPQIEPHIFGVVERVEVDASDSLQTVYFKSPVNISQLGFVEVDRK